MAGKSAGEWAYVVSLVIAVLAGLAAAAGFGSNAWVALLLVILGVIVGFLNVSEKETGSFLVASIALLVASLGASPDGTSGVFSSLGLAVPRLDVLLNSILGHLAVLVAPAAIIAAVKSIHGLASKR
jgi:hypothetical protein